MPSDVVKKAKARGNWALLRQVSNSTNKKPSSLSSAEDAFLQMLDKKDAVGSAFADVVKAAVARENLRQTLSKRLHKLKNKESEFLTKLVDNDNVTQEQLERVDFVLRNDPLYQVEGDEDCETEELTDEPQPELTTEKPESKYRQYDTVEQSGKEFEVTLNLCAAENETRTDEKKEEENALLQPSEHSYKAWNILKDQPSDYLILGTSANDESVKPHVLSPPMMNSLRVFLPVAVESDHFWLRFAMNRDGSSLEKLYDSVRQSSRTLLAIETLQGEIFGAFTSSPWRNNGDFYGSCEAFMWRMGKSRFTPTSSVAEQAKLERHLEVFPWSQENRNIQLSTRGKLVVGGGLSDVTEENSDEWGMGIALSSDMEKGTTSPCITFRNPSLSQVSKGGVFEISNIEAWALSPCFTVESAEKLEMGRMFVLGKTKRYS